MILVRRDTKDDIYIYILFLLKSQQNFCFTSKVKLSISTLFNCKVSSTLINFKRKDQNEMRFYYSFSYMFRHLVESHYQALLNIFPKIQKIYKQKFKLQKF